MEQPAPQNSAVGSALFQAELTALAGRGFPSTGLWVLTGNVPARRFYDSIGGRTAETRIDRGDGFALDEIAYVWNDLTTYRASSRQKNLAALGRDSVKLCWVACIGEKRSDGNRA